MSRIKIAIEPRFLHVPAKWTRRKSVVFDKHPKRENYFVEREEHVFVPAVAKYPEPEVIEDPWKLRTEFLRMKHTEEAAVEFLNKVGVWEAVPFPPPQSDLEETTLVGTFGVRDFFGHARPITLEELWTKQERWRVLLSPKGRTKLRAEFVPLKADARFYVRSSFGCENILPVFMEWRLGRDQYPYAVVQPITGQELLIATVWIDLVRGAKFQVCENCGTAFSGRKRKHCSESCAHAVAVRAYRKRMLKGKKSLR